MADCVAAVTDADFKQEVKVAGLHYVVTFWAPWCTSCKALDPILETLCKEYIGRVRFAKINIETEAATANRYGVTLVPTLLFFAGGELVHKIPGAVTTGDLRAAIKSTFSKA